MFDREETAAYCWSLQDDRFVGKNSRRSREDIPEAGTARAAGIKSAGEAVEHSAETAEELAPAFVEN